MAPEPALCQVPGCGRRIPLPAVLCATHWALCPAELAEALARAQARVRALEERPDLEAEPYRYQAAKQQLQTLAVAAGRAVRLVEVRPS